MNRVTGGSGKTAGIYKWFDKPFVLMLFLLVFWGSFAGMAKKVLKTMDNYQMQFYIFLIAFLAMTAIFIFTRRFKAIKALKPGEILKLVLIGLPSYLYYFFYTLALSKIPATEASVINYLFPVLIILLAIPINGEKITGIKLASIILGFAGVTLMFSNGDFKSLHFTDLTGDLLAFSAAISWALFSCLGKRNSADIFISTYVYNFTGLVLSTISMLVFSDFVVIRGAVTLNILWIGISNFVLSIFIWFRMLKSCSTALVASMSFITPFSTLLFIMLLVGERIALFQLAGLLVILSGTGLQTLHDYMVKKKQQKLKEEVC